MDPETALTSTLRAIKDNLPQIAAECLFAYYQWRLKHGYEPVDGDARAAILAPQVIDLIQDPPDIDI